MISSKQLAHAHDLNSRYQWLKKAVHDLSLLGHQASIDVVILNQRHSNDHELMQNIQGAIIHTYSERMKQLKEELIHLGVDPDFVEQTFEDED